MECKAADRKTRAEFQGYAKKVCKKENDKTFVAKCHHILDLFESLKELSDIFHTDCVTLPAVVKKMKVVMADVQVHCDVLKPDGHNERYLSNTDPDGVAEVPPNLQVVTTTILTYMQKRFELAGQVQSWV